ncbi:MAG: aminopeptidase [Cyclobacteriaceae bacterium]|nr:aminopeptidase [Cyclobacteriaceae bacterium]
MIKKIGWGLVIVLFGLVFYYHQLIGYGISQGKGQFIVLWNAQPIEEVLTNPNIADSVKQRLLVVNEIRRFAFDSLGLSPTNNYTTFFDQQGKEILWVVTACAPFKFEPKEWSFPIVGSFTYKGFFEVEKAIELTNDLKKEGYDVEMSSVSGWSTLGWFKDPVLSNMLEGTVGSMSNTLIHELTHGTVFVPDSMTFNENLASFIGRKGALKFLGNKFGRNSNEANGYAARLSDSEKFTEFMVLSATLLDSIYKNIEGFSLEEKQRYKAAFMTTFKSNIDTVSFNNPKRYQELFNGLEMNNAGFISFLNYRERQSQFDVQLEQEFNNDLSTFIAYWKLRYPN